MKDQEQNVRGYAQMLEDGLKEVFSTEAYRHFLVFISNKPQLLLPQRAADPAAMPGRYQNQRLQGLAQSRALRSCRGKGNPDQRLF